ncbi:MAG: ABC transporter ATP-binding protein [Propionibacteriaceae bacterium]|jgi:peptide/nickel transport system ATP-binding protein|nr:ABC transporter ATP-binding protein [Propionibacteriaceae bacterium]
MTLLEVEGLSVRFGRRRRRAIEDVSFAIEPSQRLGLIGESGSGKTVTALALMGLLPQNAAVGGEIRVNAVSVRDLDEHSYSRLRGDAMSMVFQEPMTALDPTMRVGRQVAEALLLHSRHQAGSSRKSVMAMLERVGLDEVGRIADSYPHQLSGGQRQRVCIAMALINSPDLVICDEPTTALDVTVQAKVLQVLNEVLGAEGAACLFISHDLAVVSQVCDQVIVMLDGRIVEAGTVAGVFSHPEHPYTKGLVATARLDQMPPGERLPTVPDFYRGQL